VAGLSYALEKVEQHGELVLLEALEHRQLANAVLVQEPGDVVAGALSFVEDSPPLPLQFGLDDLHDELVGVLPDRRERLLDDIEGASVHRVVRQVHLGRANSLHERFEEVGNVNDRERRLVELVLLGLCWNRRCHMGRRPICVICARSLSPRPLMQISTASPLFHLSFSLTTQATACDVSNAGIMPSSRLRMRSPSTASSSVTDT